MAHLSPDTFVDLLEGTLEESAVPHLAQCEACRDELSGLRRTWQEAMNTDVPEPSPLFWDHLSARVHEAVAAEPEPRRPWWNAAWAVRWFGLAAAAVAAIALVAFLNRPAFVDQRTAQVGGEAQGTPAASGQRLEVLPPLAEDESVGLLADLASDLDWDAVVEVGLVRPGGADRAVAELSANERVELQRLLTEAGVM